VTVDPMLNVTDVNETMCRMSGYSREALIGSAFPGTSRIPSAPPKE
jgi:PAS domain S-box-containing protein